MRGGGWSRQRAVPTELAREAAAASGAQAPLRPASGGPTGLPRLPRRQASAVQISERPRTPARPRAAGPIRAPCLPACDAPELGPRPGKGPEQLSCPFCQPPTPWSPNTDCRRPHPGPAHDRLAGYGRTPTGARNAPCKRREAAVASRERWGPAWGGPGPARSD